MGEWGGGGDTVASGRFCSQDGWEAAASEAENAKGRGKASRRRL